MLMMRLTRTGRKNEAQFRVVVTDRRNSPQSGKFLEVVGSYNPKAGSFQFKKDRVEHWLKNGVQPTDTIRNFLIENKVIEGKKVNVLPKKAPTTKRKQK